MEQFLRIGVITRPHGIHGEVKVYPTTDSPRRFEEVDRVIIRTAKKEITAGIENVKYFKNLAIVKFDCFNNPDDIQGYFGCDIFITRAQAQPLEDGEYYIGDLIGCEVYADEESGELSGRRLGTVKDVIQTGANDVYAVESPSGHELLFPVIPDCVKDVDVQQCKIIVHVMPGLLD